MHVRTRSHAGLAATGVAAMGLAALAAAPPVPTSPTPPAARDVRLSAASVPPGGLLTSFLGNQVVYCSLICPPLVDTVVAPIVTSLTAPATFIGAAQSGDLLTAIGVTAASITGPTNAAASEAILLDGSIPAPKATNTFETAVIGLLDVAPAAAGGLPGVLTAIETARQDTFDALNAPDVPNPAPTVTPHGVVQVAVVGAINVGAAVIFPGFNDVLGAAFAAPDAAAEELAATGDPVRAAAAGVDTAAGSVTAAAGVVANSVVSAVSNVRDAAQQSVSSASLPSEINGVTTPFVSKATGSVRRTDSTAKHAAQPARSSHTLRDVAATVSQAARSVGKGSSAGAHRAGSARKSS